MGKRRAQLVSEISVVSCQDIPAYLVVSSQIVELGIV